MNSPWSSFSKKRFLLIGNGPSALNKKVGHLIDEFDGTVIRFNDYKTEGYEEHVGSRTDVWNTVFPYTKKKGFQSIFFLSGTQDESQDRDVDSVRKFYKDVQVFLIDTECVGRVFPNYNSKRVEHEATSSGAIIVDLLLAMGAEVWIYGFDFFQSKVHHYSDTVIFSRAVHKAYGEKLFFEDLINEGKVHVFAEGEPADESQIHPKMHLVAESSEHLTKWVDKRFIGNVEIIPDSDVAHSRALDLISQNKEVWISGYENDNALQHLLMDNKAACPVAHTTAIADFVDFSGVPPSQNFSGWYHWIADSLDNKSVLVIGKDPLHAISKLSEYGVSEISYHSVGEYFSGYLRDVPTESFDCVICLEALPYAINDLLYIRHMRRIAREKIVCGYEIPSHPRHLGKAYARRVMLHRILFNAKFDEFWLGDEKGHKRELIIEKRGDKFWDYQNGDFTSKIYHQHRTYPMITDKTRHFSQAVFVSYK